MTETVEPAVLPDSEQEQQSKTRSELEPGYLVICWDDPVNLMDYVTHVFQVVFGWAKQKAEFHRPGRGISEASRRNARRTPAAEQRAIAGDAQGPAAIQADRRGRLPPHPHPIPNRMAPPGGQRHSRGQLAGPRTTR